MSKEYKLVFEPEIQDGELIKRSKDFSSSVTYMKIEDNTYHSFLPKDLDKEETFEIGDKYILVGINILDEYDMESEKRSTETTLTKIL